MKSLQLAALLIALLSLPALAALKLGAEAPSLAVNITVPKPGLARESSSNR